MTTPRPRPPSARSREGNTPHRLAHSAPVHGRGTASDERSRRQSPYVAGRGARDARRALSAPASPTTTRAPSRRSTPHDHGHDGPAASSKDSGHAGLVDRVQGPGTLSLWFVTDAGADAVETAGPRAEQRRRVTTPAQAEGLLRAHTIAVNDVGIAFTRAARELGDECGPGSPGDTR